jgi:hypothetical protein
MNSMDRNLTLGRIGHGKTTGNRTSALIQAALLALFSAFLAGCASTGSVAPKSRPVESQAASSPNDFESIMQHLNGPLHSPAPRVEPAEKTKPQVAAATKPSAVPALAQSPRDLANRPVRAPAPAAVVLADPTNDVPAQAATVVALKPVPVEANQPEVQSNKAAITSPLLSFKWVGPNLKLMVWFGAGLIFALVLRTCERLQKLADQGVSLVVQTLRIAIGNVAAMAVARFHLEERVEKLKARAANLFNRISKVLPKPVRQWLDVLRIARSTAMERQSWRSKVRAAERPH